MARGVPGGFRQRQVESLVQGRRARPVCLHRLRLAGPVQKLAAGSGQAPGRRPGCRRGFAHRCCARRASPAPGSRLAPGLACRLRASVAFESKPGKQSPAGAQPRAAHPHAALSAGARPDDLFPENTAGSGRTGEGPLQRLVRDVPALLQPDAGSARHICRLRGPAALYRRHGLRRALPTAHPPHRDHPPQGPQQRAGLRTG